MRYFVYRTGGDSKYQTLMFQTDLELASDAFEEYPDETFESIEDYLDFIVENIDGGYWGEWMELEIKDNEIKEKE